MHLPVRNLWQDYFIPRPRKISVNYFVNWSFSKQEHPHREICNDYVGRNPTGDL